MLNDNTFNNNSSNFNSVADQLPMVAYHDKKISTSLPKELISEEIPEISMLTVKLRGVNGAVSEVITVPANSTKRLNGKSSEEKEMNKYLDEADKKSISNRIR